MRFKEVTPDAVIAIRDPIRDAMASVIARMPDAFVVLDQEHQIVAANGAFLDLAQLAELGQVRGRKIDRWVGRVEVDIDILMANLREHGALRRFPTVIRGEFGGREDVEISAVAVMERDPPYFGLSIRRPQPRAIGLPPPQANGMRSFEQLKALVGQVPLRDLVRETTDIIEQMCIEAALELTGDNRASAAEMLGLSRQSLYVKLRRHGLGELDDHEST
jgi:transcriptional regulator PpsR